MTGTVPAPEDAAAARAAEQVRLRKERREAKIRAGGASRLNKITGLGGGVERGAQPEAPSRSSTPQSQATPAPTNNDDPEEVDISQHYISPRTTAWTTNEPSLSDAQLRQMMLGFEQPPQGTGPNASRPDPFAALAGAGQGMPGMPPGMEGMEGDPMMKMMQQMMGGGGAGGLPGGNPFAGAPMEGLFGGGGPDKGKQQAQQAVADKSANIWRVIHAVFALGLGLYMVLRTTFTGTKTERDYSYLTSSRQSQSGNVTDSVDRTRNNFFYLFTSVEAVLLTTRFFLDKNRAPPSGIMWSISGFLPGRLRSGVRHALQYGQILNTVRSDALVCVFVLGVCCWLRA